MKFDLELTERDVQQLATADEVVAFLARLGYNTEARLVQSPENLGITSDGAARPIRRIELLADQDAALQVYLFELSSVTVTNTRALARAFRNRAGNYLLVLTSDYERLDFVLIERFLPTAEATTIGQQQVGVRPRSLTVDRRKPSRVHVRVLRRFTYTESDPYYQYDKLLSAFGTAERSDEHFENRSLFSSYYLLVRLPERPEWAEDPKPAYRELRDLYLDAHGKFSAKPEQQLRSALFEPVFKAIGFDFKPGKASSPEAAEPDYRMHAPGSDGAPLAVCLTYPWARSLDGKDDQRDKDTPEENPGAMVVSLLEKGEAPWAIVTNGKLWRLYSQQTHSRATNYYEIDLEEALAQGDPAGISEAFRYFWLLFRRQAFERAPVQREGREQMLSFLDVLLAESADYAKELGERLKSRVFEEIFPHLAEGFIAHLRQRDGLSADLSPDALAGVFEGTLTLLYRLLFLLYAESRDLLPVKETRGYYQASLTKLTREIAEAAGTIDDEVDAKLRTHYRESGCELYARLSRLFEIIDRGDASINVPFYNGGLFLSDPPADDDSPEARNARFLKGAAVPDRHLARAIDLLARDIDARRHDLVFIDYKSLGVRQLGSIYEGLLEFKVRIAEKKLAIAKEKGREVFVPFADLDDAGKARLEKAGKIVKKGAVYLENDKRERKATGSYYTPDHIVKYIVQHTVGPVLEEKFAAIRPKIRQAQAERREFIRNREAFIKRGMKPEPESKADLIGREVVDELFNVKVLDPAMGSGHFLVETVDFITDKTLDFLNGFPWNPVLAHLERMRRTILAEMEQQGVTIDAKRLDDVNLLKRHVLKRCTYGVDLNPMAVELAKVSLWLDCFTLGAPLSFLDHHMKCGNSLIGVSVDEVRQKVEKGQMVLWGSQFAGLMLATGLMRHVGELSDITSAQVKESRSEFRKASDALAPFKRMLDVYTSQWFGNGPQNKGRKAPKAAEAESPALAFLVGHEATAFFSARNVDSVQKALDKLIPRDQEIARTALAAAADKRFFHWELEFPEVFYGQFADRGKRMDWGQRIGFDAVIGNPPYDVLAEKEVGVALTDMLSFVNGQTMYGPARSGKSNLYKLFVARALNLIATNGRNGFIVPMPLLGDRQAVGLREMILEKYQLELIEVFPEHLNASMRVFKQANLTTCIYIAKRSADIGTIFKLRVNRADTVEESAAQAEISYEEIKRFDPQELIIPNCSQDEWDIVSHILRMPWVRFLGDGNKSYQGEVNETTDWEFLSTDAAPGRELVLRGSNVCLYSVRESWRREDLFVDVASYVRAKSRSERVQHHRYERVGFQRSAPQNNFRRLIAAPIPKGAFCFDTVSYFLPHQCRLSREILLALLNSQLLDWYFDAGSTNSKINEYRLNALPVPAFGSGFSHAVAETATRYETAFDVRSLERHALSAIQEHNTGNEAPREAADVLSICVKRIIEIEAKRKLSSHLERSNLSQEAQEWQDCIDKIVYALYSLSETMIRVIELSLENRRRKPSGQTGDAS